MQSMKKNIRFGILLSALMILLGVGVCSIRLSHTSAPIKKDYDTDESEFYSASANVFLAILEKLKNVDTATVNMDSEFVQVNILVSQMFLLNGQEQYIKELAAAVFYPKNVECIFTISG